MAASPDSQASTSVMKESVVRGHNIVRLPLRHRSLAARSSRITVVAPHSCPRSTNRADREALIAYRSGEPGLYSGPSLY